VTVVKAGRSELVSEVTGSTVTVIVELEVIVTKVVSSSDEKVVGVMNVTVALEGKVSTGETVVSSVELGDGDM
jgi:hypothetical protein